jgi:hypothetical protein
MPGGDGIEGRAGDKSRALSYGAVIPRRYVAQTRAVNVGGTGTLAMTNPIAICADLGFTRTSVRWHLIEHLNTSRHRRHVILWWRAATMEPRLRTSSGSYRVQGIALRRCHSSKRHRRSWKTCAMSVAHLRLPCRPSFPEWNWCGDPFMNWRLCQSDRVAAPLLSRLRLFDDRERDHPSRRDFILPDQPSFTRTK